MKDNIEKIKDALDGLILIAVKTKQGIDNGYTMGWDTQYEYIDEVTDWIETKVSYIRKLNKKNSTMKLQGNDKAKLPQQKLKGMAHGRQLKKTARQKKVKRLLNDEKYLKFDSKPNISAIAKKLKVTRQTLYRDIEAIKQKQAQKSNNMAARQKQAKRIDSGGFGKSDHAELLRARANAGERGGKASGSTRKAKALERRQQVQQLLDEGMSDVHAIASRLNAATRTIYRDLKQLKVRNDT